MFPDEGKLREHGENQSCHPRPRERSYGFGIEERKLLKSRRGLSELGEVEKWRAIYKVLFPDDGEIPSPCKYTIFHFTLREMH